jgi:hypothetical protein
MTAEGTVGAPTCFIIVYVMKTQLHCAEIAVLRKLGDSEVICNYFSLDGTLTFWGIFSTISMTLLDRTWSEKIQ